MSYIFISYSHEDGDYVRKLANVLEENGLLSWIDEDIEYGDRWFATISEAIRDSSGVIVVMTPESEESEWVEKEILLAQREHKAIFPLLLRGREFPLLITTQYVDVTDGELPPQRFYETIKQSIPSQAATPSSRPNASRTTSQEGVPFTISDIYAILNRTSESSSLQIEEIEPSVGDSEFDDHDQINDYLEEIFQFTYFDLVANREGKISNRQWANEFYVMPILGFVSLLFCGLLLALVVSYLNNEFDQFVSILCVGVIVIISAIGVTQELFPRIEVITGELGIIDPKTQRFKIGDKTLHARNIQVEEALGPLEGMQFRCYALRLNKSKRYANLFGLTILSIEVLNDLDEYITDGEVNPISHDSHLRPPNVETLS